MEEHNKIISEINEQVREAQDLLQKKIDQNKDLRDRLEEYQEKYSKLFQDKTEIHEELLRQKQINLDLKEKAQLQQRNSDSHQFINISGGSFINGGGSFISN